MVIRQRIRTFMTEIIMKKFGSVRQKTVHDEKVLLSDRFYHLKCKWTQCPGNDNEICLSKLIDNKMEVKYCFCG